MVPVTLEDIVYVTPDGAELTAPNPQVSGKDVTIYSTKNRFPISDR